MADYLDSASPDGVSPSTASLSSWPTDELHAWLEGEFGWSAPAVSLHVFTCSICRRRVQLLREEQLTPAAQPTTAWWAPILEALQDVVTSPRVRWGATIGVIGIVLFSLTLSLLPGDPPSSDDSAPLPVERHEARGGGVG